MSLGSSSSPSPSSPPRNLRVTVLISVLLSRPDRYTNLGAVFSRTMEYRPTEKDTASPFTFGKGRRVEKFSRLSYCLHQCRLWVSRIVEQMLSTSTANHTRTNLFLSLTFPRWKSNAASLLLLSSKPLSLASNSSQELEARWRSSSASWSFSWRSSL